MRKVFRENRIDDSAGLLASLISGGATSVVC